MTSDSLRRNLALGPAGIALIAGALCVASTTVGAVEIKLLVAGQAGIEDPSFDVLLDGIVIGGGTVTKAAKPGAGDSFSGDRPFEPYTQQFEFSSPDGPTSGTVGVRFLNDYYDAAKGIDANLYVLEVAIDGQKLDLSRAQIEGSKDEPRERLFWKDALVLPWYATASLAYGLAGTPQTTTETPETESGAAAAPVESAVAPEPPPVPVCAVTRSADVTFGNGEVILTPESKAVLDAVVAGDLDGCAISVLGYSSMGGPADINLAVSQARAAQVEAYLRARVPEGLNITAEGIGGTDKFGVAAMNRRVVVSIE
ncbi:carbohydrate-binding domain-containing protein [Devosia sp.]|uniref:OmpA family protein n=1 Tax=Devosia sp. TaxID=1871048 RepID=UPI001AC1DDD7|nr:carbohydrate-binding domain-containing protein [Devosia sp.]MBN9309605.1 hypothetical protein [Devosia sp.]